MNNGSFAGDTPAASPPTVSRGMKQHRVGYLGLDSVYVILEYPHDDVFKRWNKYVDDEKHPKLKKGIPCEHVVLRNGGLGYSLSVWDEDARLYMTDRVEDNLKGTPLEGQGMGLMLQLGPKWLVRFGDILDTARFKCFIAMELGVAVEEIQAMVLGTQIFLQQLNVAEQEQFFGLLEKAIQGVETHQFEINKKNLGAL